MLFVYAYAVSVCMCVCACVDLSLYAHVLFSACVAKKLSCPNGTNPTNHLMLTEWTKWVCRCFVGCYCCFTVSIRHSYGKHEQQEVGKTLQVIQAMHDLYSNPLLIWVPSMTQTVQKITNNFIVDGCCCCCFRWVCWTMPGKKSHSLVTCTLNPSNKIQIKTVKIEWIF